MENSCDLGLEFWVPMREFKSVLGLNLRVGCLSMYDSGLWETYSRVELRCGSYGLTSFSLECETWA